MQSLIRGQKIKLSDLSKESKFQIGVSIFTTKQFILDISCFGVDAQNQLSDDRYFIFYNQKISPCGSLSSLGTRNGDQEQFEVDLSRLPATIRKLVFVVTIDGDGIMSQIQNGYLRLMNQTHELTRFSFTDADFSQEKAIIVGEIYFKEIWRFSAVGQGFNGGLSALLKHFGGAEISSDQEVTVTSEIKISKAVLLEKQLEKEAPHLINLAKKLSITLEKKQLQNTIAKVAIVMDASGSMSHSYQKGIVQSVLDRIALVAARLDDDGNLETWFYASTHKKFPDITIKNLSNYLKNYVKSGYMSIVDGLGGRNNEPPVMDEVLATYKLSEIPALVIFITDGGVSQKGKIKRILIEASHYPIFWQFVGLAGTNYGILEELDTMQGRFIDNAGFFHVDDLARISDEELYDRLLSEFPMWLKEAKKKRIINF